MDVLMWGLVCLCDKKVSKHAVYAETDCSDMIHMIEYPYYWFVFKTIVLVPFALPLTFIL